MSRADVSVVIPTYNSGALLKRALDSVIAQTLPPEEILVVDDGSTDTTRELVSRYGPLVSYVYQDNRGASHARNRGILQARGQWVAFLDADDEWLPQKLHAQMEILARDPHPVWCASKMMVVHDPPARPDPIATAPSTSSHTAAPTIEGQIVPYFQSQLLCPPSQAFQTSGFIVHRSVFSEVGLFDPSLKVSQDRDMWWRIAMAHPLLGFCPQACYYYYAETAGSLTKRGRDRSEGLSIVCGNMRRALSAGSATAAAFEPYARRLAVNYLKRWATREIMLDKALRQEAQSLFPLHRSEKILLYSLQCSPRPAARLLARWTGEP